MEVIRKFIRFSGVLLIVASVLFTVGFLTLPGGDSASAALSSAWLPAQAMLLLAYVFSLLGWFGAYLKFAETDNGIAGILAFVVLYVGFSIEVGMNFNDVFFTPYLAAIAPSIVDKMSAGSLPATIGILGAILSFAGAMGFGLSTAFAGVFPKWPGLLLAAGSLIAFIGIMRDHVLVADAGIIATQVGQFGIGLSCWMHSGFKTEPVTLDPLKKA